MKTQLLKVFPLSVLLLSSIYFLESCSKESIQTTVQTDAEGFYKIDQPVSFNDVFVFPTGTRLKLEKKELHYKLPQGYKLFTNTKSSGLEKINSSSAGSVSCSCSSGSVAACTPYLDISKKPYEAGCQSVGDCTSCSVSKKRMSGGYDVILDAVILNMNSKVDFLSSVNNLGVSNPKSFVFENKEIQTKMNAFIDKHLSITDQIKVNKTSKNQLPEGFLYAPVNFLGMKIYIPLNTTEHELGKMLEKTASGGTEFDCVCNQSESRNKTECRLRGSGQFIYCYNAGCHSCTLTY